MIDAVALSLTSFSARRHIGDRLRAGEPPGAITRSLLAAMPDEPGRAERLLARARRTLARADEHGITAVAWSASEYPALLRTIYDPPPLLWSRGDPSWSAAPAVAIVGSRAGSPHALAVAEQLAGDLALHGVVVVSGLARGVDSAAHRGALSAGGRTLAVLGSGVDVVYPPEHAPLAAEIGASGALISELAPGTRPRSWFFPLRNRIISGVSLAVVVIEAGERSGSLITARCALEQGRDVLAVPGNVLGGRNRGGHALLRDGAKIVESADDILDELNLGALGPMNPAAGGPASERRQTGPGRLEPDAPDAVLAALTPGEAHDLDHISAISGLPGHLLLTRLLALELRGQVRRVDGGRFVRLDGSC